MLNRGRAIETLEQERLDLAVIGGAITGAGVTADEAAAEGIAVR